MLTSSIRRKRTIKQREKVFTIIGREIAVAVKEGGADPANNSKLRDVIAKAKASNMPNDTIERGIKKAAGDVGNVNYETVTYEGYGPNGTAIIVQALTDNKNRTAANVRSAFTRETEMSAHRAAYLLCLTRRDRSSLIRKNARWMQMTL